MFALAQSALHKRLRYARNWSDSYWKENLVTQVLPSKPALYVLISTAVLVAFCCIDLFAGQGGAIDTTPPVVSISIGPPPASSVHYVDPDFTGTPNGTGAAPWRYLDASAWSTINTELATGDVTVFFSARE